MAAAYTFNINCNGEDQSLVLAKELCNWTNFIGLLNEKLPTINNTGYSIHYFDKEKNKKYLTDATDFQQLLISLDDKKETQVTIYHGQDNDNLINGWVFEPEFNESNDDNQQYSGNNNTNGERTDYATTFHEWGKLMDKHHILIQNNLYINMLTSRFAHALSINPNLNVISSLDLWLTNFDQTQQPSSSSCHHRGKAHRREFIASLPQDVGEYLMSAPHPGRRHHHHHHHHHHQRGRGPMPPFQGMPSFPGGGPFGFWSGLFNHSGSSSQEKECSNEKGKQPENTCSRTNSPFIPGDYPFSGGLMGMTKHWKKMMKMRMKDYYLQQLQLHQQLTQQKSNHPCYNTNEHDSTSSNDTSSGSSDDSSSDSSDNENEKHSFRDGKNNELSPRMQAKFWKSFAKQYRREHAFDGHEHIKHHKKRHGRRHGRHHGHHHHHHHHPSPPHQPPVPPFNFNHPPPPPFSGFEFGRPHHHHHHHPHPHHHPHHHAPPSYMEEYFSKMNIGDSKKH